ncbi:transcription factor ATF2 [Pochonia chlamydosporia 170]|uniref:Transcription factor ATF2 n=1 Tax=Pochonia chlamydosporia 170 TaxID=1380566 RepID=A0A179FJD5_METCM|nr:transcription factor ATF2 [Pochonia chlamydosporia 170]OAQ65371.1 transcription factor ATF2 [Pochonia chlamydosporia 170]
MSTADFLIGQMAGENEIDPVLFDPAHRSFTRSPQANFFDDGTTHTLPYPLSGLPGGPKSQPAPFENQLGGLKGNLYPFSNGCQYPPTALDPVVDTSGASSNIKGQGTDSQTLSPDDTSKKSHKPSKKASKKTTETTTKSSKQKPSAETKTSTAPKTRKQPKREAAKSKTQPTEEPKEKKSRNRRQRSLERNRVAASKCRKRKKQWTDNLEQKKSGLESIHNELQAEYMQLLQESSQLKNFLIGHSGCQDPNIDVWIKNEASKFVRNLHMTNRVNSVYSVPSLDGNGSTSLNSSSASPVTGMSQMSPDLENEGLDSDEYSDEGDAFDGDFED